MIEKDLVLFCVSKSSFEPFRVGSCFRTLAVILFRYFFFSLSLYLLKLQSFLFLFVCLFVCLFFLSFLVNIYILSPPGTKQQDCPSRYFHSNSAWLLEIFRTQQLILHS